MLKVMHLMRDPIVLSNISYLISHYGSVLMLNGTNMQHSGNWVSFQTELMFEIYSKSLVRATGKV